MADEDDIPQAVPPSGPAPPRPRSQRPSRPPSERLPFERIVPDLLKRGLEASRGVGDSLFSKDIAASVVSQLGEAREGIVNVVGQEVGRFLRQADVASELRNVLAGLEVEAKIKLKFRKSPDADEPASAEEPEPCPPDEGSSGTS